MKCTECPDYADCRKKHNLTIKRKHCPKAKDIKVLTNADRIRAMNDEEIAQWLCLNYSCTKCLGQELCTINDGKANGLLKWLKQPAEVQE